MYIQANYANQVTLGVSGSVGFSFVVQGSVGAGLTAPSGYSGVKPFSGNFGAANAQPVRCETKSTFYA
jgi:hypothetical protein